MLALFPSAKMTALLNDYRRDIAVRAVAEAKGPDTPVRDIMSFDVCYCFEDQELDEVAASMADVKVRRLRWSIVTSDWSALFPRAISPLRTIRVKSPRPPLLVSPSRAASIPRVTAGPST
jgi:hypothetical protein